MDRKGTSLQATNNRLGGHLPAFLVRLQGRAAGEAGQALSPNPFEASTPERLEWFEGWFEATKLR